MTLAPATSDKFSAWLDRVRAEREAFDASAPVFLSEVAAEDWARNILQSVADVMDRERRRAALLENGIWLAPDPDFQDDTLRPQLKAWVRTPIVAKVAVRYPDTTASLSRRAVFIELRVHE